MEVPAPFSRSVAGGQLRGANDEVLPWTPALIELLITGKRAADRNAATLPWLDPRCSERRLTLREMLILRMGWNCRSEYEWAKHVGSVGRARHHGLDPTRIAEGPQAAGWDPFESTLLRASDELYRDGIVSDTTWRALSDRFDTGLVMSAVFTTSDYRAISLSLNTYGVQLEEGDERFPQLSGSRGR